MEAMSRMRFSFTFELRVSGQRGRRHAGHLRSRRFDVQERASSAHTFARTGFAAACSSSLVAMSDRPRTLVDVLERHAEMRPHARAFTLLGDGENESATLCFAQLHARVRVIAAWLTHQHLRGCTVLLMMRDGLQFIETFMGCLAAGVIPVPVTFPRPNRQVVTLHAIRKSV